MARKNEINFIGRETPWGNMNLKTQSNVFHICNILGIMIKNTERELKYIKP